MKKTLLLFFTLLLSVLTFNKTQAQLQNLTYEVRASNFVYYDSVTFTDPITSGLKNVIEFDIYIQQTNVPATDDEIMRFAMGQYYINMNFGFNVASPTAADTAGFAKFSYILGSTNFRTTALLPSNPHVKPAGAATDPTVYYPEGDLVNGIRGGYTNLNSNSPVGSSSDIQISSVFPGTKVGRYRLKKRVSASWSSPYFASVSHHFRWKVGPLSASHPNPFTKIFAYNGLYGANTDVTGKGTFIMDTLGLQHPLTTLNLKVLMEGFYYPVFNQMSRKDSVTVLLRKATFPYEIVYTAKSLIDSISFAGSFQFQNLLGDTFYIVVNHFNSVEVWSKAGGENLTSGGIVNYDFTNSISKAYGENLKLKNSKYCMFSGDINQDGIIDASDLSAVENDISEGVVGRVSTDVNGDDFVDASDLSITDNNKDDGVIAITP